MEMHFIEKNWDIAIVDTEAAKRLWGLFARRQENAPDPTPENNLPLRIVADNHMIDGNSTVLDLGCGTGRFTVRFAERCRHVTGVDFSAEMMSKATCATTSANLSNVSFVLENWHELSLEKYGWHQHFDLVFANMSPAVQSVKTFAMLTEASRAWCFMAKPTRREDRITSYLLNKLGVDWYHRPFDVDMMYAFAWLSLKGLLPKVEYFKSRWERTLSLDEAAIYYKEWLGMNYPLTEAQKAGIRPTLAEIAQDGMVNDSNDVTISILYWHV